MNPAFSVIAFTTIAGAAQGLVVALAVALLAGRSFSSAFALQALLVSGCLLVIGLGASFLHLGRPERAWRAAAMWRTSWLSREVIALPAFIAVVGLGWLGLRSGGAERPVLSALWSVSAIAMAALLWVCTGMIYACLRFIEEWAHPLTIVNFTLTGLSSGLVLCGALAFFAKEPLVSVVAPFALVATLAAWFGRFVAMRRNGSIRHRSTLQTAIGVDAPRLQQKSMGMSAGSFNTREFFHHASASALRHVRLTAHLAGFIVPALLVTWAMLSGSAGAWVLAVVVQGIGLFADRWLFFAQAKHPQNLYYQIVS
ncbi:MAG: DmsC/YnfH family molybdoenzyme membrane anchor subunit [Caldimonas sp.]